MEQFGKGDIHLLQIREYFPNTQFFFTETTGNFNLGNNYR